MKKDQVKQNFGMYKKIGNLKTIMTLNVTSRGDSLCIIIPKDVVDVSAILSGDKLRVWLLDHYRKRHDEEEEKEE
jgi:hypothetical protein